MIPPRARFAPLALALGVTAVGCAAAAPTPGPAPEAGDTPSGSRWIDNAGTTTLGFGVLRVAPPAGAAAARFRVRFTDFGDGYASNATSAVVVVLPGDAFARSEGAFADCWRAFARAEQPADAGRPLEAAAEFRAEGDGTFVVAYGPWEGPDVGRPPSDRHTFTLAVEPLDGGAYRWVDSEAGEMVTTSWTNRPGVARGGPATDPLIGRQVWIESRVLVLYDAKVARPADGSAASEPERERMPLPPDLYAVLARVPIKWR
jgi:hypothetical protein